MFEEIEKIAHILLKCIVGLSNFIPESVFLFIFRFKNNNNYYYKSVFFDYINYQILWIYSNGDLNVLSLELASVIASLVIIRHSLRLMNVLMLTLEHS